MKLAIIKFDPIEIQLQHDVDTSMKKIVYLDYELNILSSRRRAVQNNKQYIANIIDKCSMSLECLDTLVNFAIDGMGPTDISTTMVELGYLHSPKVVAASFREFCLLQNKDEYASNKHKNLQKFKEFVPQKTKLLASLKTIVDNYSKEYYSIINPDTIKLCADHKITKTVEVTKKESTVKCYIVSINDKHGSKKYVANVMATSEVIAQGLAIADCCTQFDPYSVVCEESTHKNQILLSKFIIQ
jgi:hypothetical protein